MFQLAKPERYDLMPSLTSKIIAGHTYYYARICKRVGGKPKIVQTIYLGTIESLMARAQGTLSSTAPKKIHVAEFGGFAALFLMADRLRLVQIIDQHVHKRGQGPSVGQYMLLAAINRALCPSSKAMIGEWFEETIGPRLTGIHPKQLSSQAFWNHMNLIKHPALIRIENDLLSRLLDEFKLDLNCLLYDATNFYTYINTTTKGELARRGHNKQKRNDLRQVSLGMMTTTDFHIPLLHMVYGGNVADSTQFGSVIETLVGRYRALRRACDQITLVFDKGNNSAANLEDFERTRLHFVGSLKLRECPELLTIPLRKYRKLTTESLEDVSVYRTRREALGKERTVIITHNENLLCGQLQGIGHNLTKCRGELQDIQHSMRRWASGKTKSGKRPTLEGTRKKINQILGREYMKQLLKVNLKEVGTSLQVSYRFDSVALLNLTRTTLGKTVLFTDNHEWTDEQVVLAYRGQYHIEHAFREMKHPRFLGWNPRFHWTDQKIRVHAFYCVAALTLVSLLRRELAGKGLVIGTERLLKELIGIREVMTVQPRRADAKPNLSCDLTHLNETQQKLYDLLNLGQLRPS